MIKECHNCHKAFEAHGNAKYCPDCRKRKKDIGWIYIAYDPELNICKIGISQNVDERITTLKRQYPLSTLKEYCRLKVSDYRGIEKYLHQKFFSNQTNGEFFKISPQSVLNRIFSSYLHEILKIRMYEL